MGSYKYEPLNPTKHQIRIFTLLPSRDFDSALQGRLRVVDLDSSPPYESLSYVWGVDPPLSPILNIDGFSFDISAHLANVLKHIRQPDTKRDLWIDAVCIEQNNNDEKDHQVTMMGHIYRNCVIDLVWLENPPKEKGAGQGGVGTSQILALEQGLEFVESAIQRGRTLRDFGGHYLDPDEHTWMKAAFATPRLWSRVWIVQELACAPDVLLLGGKRRLKWDTLRRFLDLEPDFDIHHWPWGRAIHENGLDESLLPIAEIERQRGRMRSGSEESSLFEVLARFSDRDSTKPEDKIYGLLGLVPPHHRRLTANYGDRPAKVFIEATKEIIRQSQNLDILCQSPWERRGVPQCSRIGPRTTIDLPSWAVDFGASMLSRDMGRSYDSRELMFAGRGIFCAGGDFCEGSWHVDGSVLQLRGYLLGRIGPPQPQPPVSRYKFVPDIWGNEINDGIYDATGEPKFQALWRTMVTDCKGYPMERLDPECIRKDDAIFRGEHAGDLSCEMVWRRIKRNWAFYVSEEGLFVMARKHVQEGDFIAVIEGAKVPLILQSVDDNRFEIVSPAYVHGYMDRDPPVRSTRLSKRDIFIV
jgi:hypothetical protein